MGPRQPYFMETTSRESGIFDIKKYTNKSKSKVILRSEKLQRFVPQWDKHMSLAPYLRCSHYS